MLLGRHNTGRRVLPSFHSPHLSILAEQRRSSAANPVATYNGFRWSDAPRGTPGHVPKLIDAFLREDGRTRVYHERLSPSEVVKKTVLIDLLSLSVESSPLITNARPV